jgi:hypothetical protein
MNRKALPLTLHGSQTCEDTALVRDRLRAWGIPFAACDREDDSRVNEVLEKWNHGNLVTPTLMLGDDQVVFSEPWLEELESKLRAAGYEFEWTVNVMNEASKWSGQFDRCGSNKNFATRVTKFLFSPFT